MWALARSTSWASAFAGAGAFFERATDDRQAKRAKYARLAIPARRWRSGSGNSRSGSTSSSNRARKVARAAAVVSRGSWREWVTNAPILPCSERCADAIPRESATAFGHR